MSYFYKKSAGLALCTLFSASSLFAQQTITGTVTDATGPVSGVTVSVKGTARGTQTSANGTFTIQAAAGETLRFSNIGYKATEIVVGSTKTINVSLVQDSEALGEVVVTAMGVKREKKSLGYSFQEIQGNTLTDARENNIANALAGKVSSLQVIKGSNGPSSSSKIVLRGFNSLSGDNQPLIVVDGVPMDNFSGSSNNDFWNPTADMGSGLGDLNPEDIESMSVLKGGAASALYGSRASNGVILITTKSGKAKDGVGISYSTITGIENIFMAPKLQNDFSQGDGGIFGKLSTASWGEKINGQQVELWDGTKENLKHYDNLGNFFETGFNTTQNINFQQAVSDKVNLYTSATYLHDKSKTPGMKLNRLNLINRVNAKFGARNQWSTDVKVQYMRNMAYNRAVGGQNDGNYYAQALLFPRSLDITQFKSGMDELGVKQTWYLEDSGLNPYWAAYNKLSQDTRDRYLMNATVKYDFNDWLSADVRVGSDNYSTKYDSKTYTGSHMNNSYSTGTDKFFENNYIVSLQARKDNLFGKWGGTAALYGQIMERNRTSLSSSAGNLRVPNLFTLGNNIGNPGISESISKKQINSIYANFEVNYDNFWFVNFTGRNDWTSTLHPDNNSYFYPSVSTSLVLSDLINKNGEMPSWFNFAKLRGSYAQTGRDMDPYQLYNTFTIGNDPNNVTTASKQKVLFDQGVVNELQKSIEVGLETRFVDNRIGFDFTYYKNNSTNQLINIPMNNLSGYQSFKANAGNILNEGIEIMLNADIIRTDNFKWNLNANISKNINKIIELHPESKRLKLGGIDNVEIFAEEKQRYGAIYGTKFLRVEDKDSPYNGQLLLTSETGLPQSSGDRFLLGDQTARALAGVTNSFAYKNFGLSVQIDGRFGGKFFAGSQRALQSSGAAAETVVNGERNKFVVDGVISSNGSYEKNTVEVNPEDYWNIVANSSGNLGITEQNLYNATNVRIRNLQLSYSIPKSALKSSIVKNARIAIAVNNLAMLKSYANGVDPESVYAINSNAVGFENLSFPTSRSYFLNLSIGF
ncbi:SusC/RagA family TonB-linked outer membrane protein [Sphingobacterium faecium]|uniref:SusC/RagA family TonB-linked outer membrane protein n=1 Tax=Sphingobacterium faecium TaxID=34087 RepID=UPI0024695BCD|nr:SusC/RagA family TonB-linked outer membrane protein [Sphingobacterium faecium]MDH5828058.1 SusC/RagA family TonB-linked outer membrane protein [Sphingobacterium faecium]